MPAADVRDLLASGGRAARRCRRSRSAAGPRCARGSRSGKRPRSSLPSARPAFPSPTGSSPRGDHVAYGLAGVARCREHADDRAETGRLRHQPHPERRDDAERPLAAADQPGQVEVRRLRSSRSRAELDHVAVGEDHLHAEHVVGGDEVLEGVDPAGVGRGVAADVLARWLEGSGAKWNAAPPGRAATASESCVLRTPASTWATRFSRSIARMRFIRVVETITPFSNATHPPANPVPDPRGTICTPASARARTTPTTCCVSVGNTTAAGRALAIVKPSHCKRIARPRRSTRRRAGRSRITGRPGRGARRAWLIVCWPRPVVTVLGPVRSGTFRVDNAADLGRIPPPQPSASQRIRPAACTTRGRLGIPGKDFDMAEETSPQPQQGENQSVQLMLDERELRTTFSNAYRIHTTAEEVVLDFGFNMANPNPQGGAAATAVQGERPDHHELPEREAAGRLAVAARQPLRAVVRPDPDAAGPAPRRPGGKRPHQASIDTREVRQGREDAQGRAVSCVRFFAHLACSRACAIAFSGERAISGCGRHRAAALRSRAWRWARTASAVTGTLPTPWPQWRRRSSRGRPRPAASRRRRGSRCRGEQGVPQPRGSIAWGARAGRYSLRRRSPTFRSVAVEGNQALLTERHQGRLGARRAEQVPDDGAESVREIVLDLAHLALGGAEQVHVLEPQQAALLAADVGRQHGDPAAEVGEDAVQQPGGDDAVAEIGEDDRVRPVAPPRAPSPPAPPRAANPTARPPPRPA